MATERPADAQPRITIRSISRLLPRADAPAGPFQFNAAAVPGGQQRDRLEPSRTSNRRDLRSGARRQDPPEIQLRAVLVRPGNQPGTQRQPQLDRLVAASLVV